MRVLIVNTSESGGGAAIAARRLVEALNNNGVKAKMLVRDKVSDQITVAGVRQSWGTRLGVLWERFCIFAANGFDRGSLFRVDTSGVGTDITKSSEFKEADVIHLHWINQGFLSLGVIRRIVESGKVVIWTMHDEWPFTGICHYSGSCVGFKSACGRCPLVGGKKDGDLSRRVFRRKQHMLRGGRVVFVACSEWLGGLAAESALLMGREVVCIPNTINSHTFCPGDVAEARRRWNLPSGKRLLLFGSPKATDPRKGLDFLVEACGLLKQGVGDFSDVGVVVVGRNGESVAGLFPFPVYVLDFVDDERRMALLYNAVDAYVTPSLEDNLPNTVMEAMMCGVPCVGFRVGGIPEMIEHKVSGYLAEERNAADLAEGIRFVLDVEHAGGLRAESRRLAMARYGETHIASRYISLYRKAGACN